VALLKKDAPEEVAAKQEQKQANALEKAWNAFWASPAGRARLAYRNGDHVFQYNIDVMNQQAIIVKMQGSTTSSKTGDPTAILNSVCREGWEIVSADFPFVMTGQQSRDKFLSSARTSPSLGLCSATTCSSGATPTTSARAM
jgi:hypothetical protein